VTRTYIRKYYGFDSRTLPHLCDDISTVMVT